MIKFTELRVHKGHLIIVAEVRKIENYYDNVYISKIKIDTQDTFSSSGPSDNLVYEISFENQPKEVSLDLPLSSFKDKTIDMNKTMFFVYGIAGGVPNPSTPCGFDEETSVGVTFSLCPIYNETMQYVKEVENSCEIPRAFIDMILQYKAIQYSINSGHFTQAIKYYNKFYKNRGFSVSTLNTCGCHG